MDPSNTKQNQTNVSKLNILSRALVADTSAPHRKESIHSSINQISASTVNFFNQLHFHMSKRFLNILKYFQIQRVTSTALKKSMFRFWKFDCPIRAKSLRIR